MKKGVEIKEQKWNKSSLQNDIDYLQSFK